MANILQIDIPASHGFLEAILKENENTSLEAAAILCHPHPQFGGSMHNKVVFNAARALSSLGIPVLRFNFRGVGRSTGNYDNGIGEREDVITAIQWLKERYPDNKIYLGGFSFGAWVSWSVGVQIPDVKALIGLGMPVNMYQFSEMLDCDKSKLVVQGELDEYGLLHSVQSWYDSLLPPKQLSVINGADHFFTDHLDEMQNAITAFMRSYYLA